MKLKQKTKSSVTISWKKTSGATGYKVYMSKSKKGKYTLLTKTHSKKYIKWALAKHKKYWIKVRAYKKIKKKQVQSPYSTPKVIVLK